MRTVLLLLLAAITLTSCQIEEKITFNQNGSGVYEMGFDMSEIMKMGASENDSVPPKVLDTVMNFASFLDEKRDSILTLPIAEQEKLEKLRPLQFSMKVNEEESKMDMRLAYSFKEIGDVSNFAEVVEMANIKELDELGSKVSPTETEPSEDGEKKDSMSALFSMSESFITTFSKKKFTRKITKKALEESLAKKDTTMKSDDPFSDMIRFKQIYIFPYKIKSVSNANAKILSNFKGVEIEANMFEMNNDPTFFDVEVQFEKE
ncbi:MAG: hypothetical protein COA50_00065 [Flavobacteriaceae bacterium]|nr:MAG: hypothetical protein COA50_00065 [Flavobacteriaceae bacterium]